MKKVWPDDETLIAHIHYQLLSIATKACLYYQMCCISFTKAEKRPDKLTPTSIKVVGNDVFLNRKSQTYSQVRFYIILFLNNNFLQTNKNLE